MDEVSLALRENEVIFVYADITFNFTGLGFIRFIIGGARLYKDTFSIMDGLYITHIKKEYDGDVYMPPFEDYFLNKTLI